MFRFGFCCLFVLLAQLLHNLVHRLAYFTLCEFRSVLRCIFSVNLASMRFFAPPEYLACKHRANVVAPSFAPFAVLFEQLVDVRDAAWGLTRGRCRPWWWWSGDSAAAAGGCRRAGGWAGGLTSECLRPLRQSSSARPHTALPVRCPSQTPSILDPHQWATLCLPRGPHHATCWRASSPAPRRGRHILDSAYGAQKVNYNMIHEYISHCGERACARTLLARTVGRSHAARSAEPEAVRAGHGRARTLCLRLL